MSKNYNTTLQTNNSSLEEIITKLNNMPEAGDGLDTSDATATTNDILNGKTAYVDGEKITGTIDTKTADDLIANGATVTVPAGYYGTQATKTVVTATQATPTITIDSTNGLITATVTQDTGYIIGGTKSGTKQLAFQAAQTITPGTIDQTAVGANYYTGGVITVKGDSNLVAENIKNGVDIFGVTGTYEGTGGGDTSIEDSLITGNVTTYTNNRVTAIGAYAFYGYARLTAVSFPQVTTIGGYAFYNCSSLTSVSFPQVTTIGDYAFRNCNSLTSVSFPKCTAFGSFAFGGCSRLTTVSFPQVTTIGSYTFQNCSNLTAVSFPQVTTIGGYAFLYCSKLSRIYLGNSVVCSLQTSNAFNRAGIWSDKGSIFVPASLLASYKAATNWVFFSNRIFSYAF